ncbi:Bifunctional hemolysin/adenylate cyclase precursor [Roseovarius sp. THAF9]|uniref:calcium-binding protein n=1 Tax=Roseovarius sp. THAF9 TaxID=2587847 RepID=UPI0012697A71|nr:calcium-binding protein [Roseovarius sp. THAF9]QFT92051.1 Bifunctional hemolysin/adenylate cyclase precursor [Roseovarius sp. THAF9]
MNFIYGTNLAELLEGIETADLIQGFGGSDFIYGNGGNDWIYGGAGMDNIKGGDGDDVAFGQSGNDTIEGGDGNDHLDGGDGDDSIFGNGDDDTVTGGAGHDTMDGGAGIDTADYSDSNSLVWASLQTGFALSHVPPGYSILDGDQDTLLNIENLTGSDYGDWLQGNEGANILSGGDGDDRFEGHGGNDDILGGLGNDELYGGDGDDFLRPGQGDATVSGGTGHDTLKLDMSEGGAGWTVDLQKEVGTQAKPLFKVSKDDSDKDADSKADAETDTRARTEDIRSDDLTREPIEDAGLWPFPNEPVKIEAEELEFLSRMFGGSEKVMQAFGDFGLPDIPGFEDKPDLEGYLPGGGSSGPYTPVWPEWEMKVWDIEDVIGSDGNDKIYGNGADNALYSMGGDDLLDGRGGNDFLYSNSGEATLMGGAGEDRLIASAGSGVAEMTGGADDDVFVFESNPYSDTGHRGTIMDFAEGDLIEIFDYNATGPLSFSETGLFDATGPQVRVLQALGDASATLEVDHDGDGAADWSVDIVKTDAMHLIGIDDLVL